MSEDEGIIENVMRCTEHQDWGTITFLYQDHVGGLEAKMTNGQWVPVKPVKDGIVLNAGLILEMWSGGLFPATVT
jgi:isopenicillin N synthase-like dioxygenase